MPQTNVELVLVCSSPDLTGNLRLQEMMSIMASERGGKLYATDERFVLTHPSF